MEGLITIQAIKYTDILDSPESAALLTEYSAECSIPEIGEPCPQRHMYEGMEKMGLMHSLGVYEGAKLVGFATLLIFVLPHYGKKIANVESLFLGKDHRRSGVGGRLMTAVQTFATEMECCGVLYNSRVGSQLERLLELMPNYQRTNSVFLWKP